MSASAAMVEYWLGSDIAVASTPRRQQYVRPRCAALELLHVYYTYRVIARLRDPPSQLSPWSGDTDASSLRLATSIFVLSFIVSHIITARELL